MNHLPQTLYIHIPFCIKKCPYCDFTSYALDHQPMEDAYIQALIADLKTECDNRDIRKIHAIFIGGGTPSLFSASSYETLLSTIQSMNILDASPEITLEMNPGTVTPEKIYHYFQAGINRLSIGVQSFNNKHLKQLSRIHDAQTAIKTIELAKKAGFENINLDLMFGLPEQTREEALNDLEMAVQWEPTHVSWYQLTLEPETPFAQEPERHFLPSDDQTFEFQKAGERYLKKNNYYHYETSAYGKKGFFCQHNLNYWQFGDYIGIGAGAHGKITSFRQNKSARIERYQKFDHPKDYLNSAKQKKFIATQRFIKKNELPFEFMMNALRLIHGVPKKLFEERTGCPVKSMTAELEQAITLGLLRPLASRFQLTRRGQHFLNDCLQLFL